MLDGLQEAKTLIPWSLSTLHMLLGALVQGRVRSSEQGSDGVTLQASSWADLWGGLPCEHSGYRHGMADSVGRETVHKGRDAA